MALTVASIGFSQSQIEGSVSNLSQNKITNLEMVVTVDSAKDIENTFKVEDIEKILKETKENEVITFSLICNGSMMSNEKKSTITYKIKGNSSEPEEFLTLVTKLRKSAIEYYEN
ncbi:hypothetical protein ACPX19_07205 [Winogradskyella sp. HB-48]|uniref:hypothetical protein n=1 Tax=Winogradskyella sp. HB-48 TaxID=3416808 RepID=UPI003CF5D104